MFDFKDKNGRKLTNRETVEKIKNRIINIFLDLELLLLRWIGHIPIHTARRFFYRLCGVKIGSGSTIHMWCNFFNPANIVIGEDTVIGDHAFLDGRGKIKIGSHTGIASQVLIYNSQHDINKEDFQAETKEVSIDDYVFIGPRVIILPGVKIGKAAVVGAGAVVTKDVAPGSIVGGIPAEIIGKRKIENPHYRLGRARLFQ